MDASAEASALDQRELAQLGDHTVEPGPLAQPVGQARLGRLAGEIGDEPFQRKCIARIREMHAAGKTLVVVSHDLNMVADLCERGIVLRDGKVRFDGESHEAVAVMRE